MCLKLSMVLGLVLLSVAIGRRPHGPPGHHRQHRHHHKKNMSFFVPQTATDSESCTTEAATAVIISGHPGWNNTALDNLNPGDTLAVCIQKKHWMCDGVNTGDVDTERQAGEVGDIMAALARRMGGLAGRMRDRMRDRMRHHGGPGPLFGMEEFNATECNSWRFESGKVVKMWRPDSWEQEDGEEDGEEDEGEDDGTVDVNPETRLTEEQER